ncbi:MAG: hypothetical protein WA989_09335 [Henriciella sp.]|uniref:hypothetical protein n=1 Tax=Henriciella sp. TaxID=1968823 RepID=UPI003C7797C0
MQETQLNLRQEHEKLLELAEDLFGEDGRDQVSKAEKHRRDRAYADAAMAKAIKRTFSSNHGRKTLAWLKSITVDREVVGLAELLEEKPEDRVLLQAGRAGGNEIYLQVILAMAQADALENQNGDEE